LAKVSGISHKKEAFQKLKM